MIDINVKREAYDRREISGVGWSRLSRNRADGLRKMTTRKPPETLLDSENAALQLINRNYKER